MVGAGEGLHGEGVVLAIIIVTINKINSVNGMFYKGQVVCKVHVGVKLSIASHIVLSNPCHSKLLFLWVELAIVFMDIREAHIEVHFVEAIQPSIFLYTAHNLWLGLGEYVIFFCH